MSVFTYHLVKMNFVAALKAYFLPPRSSKIPGLIHAECMSAMTLGSPVFSQSRILVKQIAFFAQWENEAAVDDFLKSDGFGKKLAKGWHTRLTYLRQWGEISGFQIPNGTDELENANQTVVAVTIARMKFFQIPRFIRWGRPVEKLVRDHPGTLLALASIRFPRTVSTFSIWKSQKEMTDMVHGHSEVPSPKRHSKAMQERNRKDFHIEFTTLRFKPISEFGEWKGKSKIMPNLK